MYIIYIYLKLFGPGKMTLNQNALKILVRNNRMTAVWLRSL